MGINLKGFATGFAKTLATRIEDEREKEEKILSNRFNLAASNRLTRQKEASELRKVYETRVKNFSSVYPMATEQQIAAAISTETNYDTLMKAHEEGFSDDEKANILSNYVKVGEMPEKFTTAMDLVEQRVQPQVGEVKPAEGQTNKLLGFIDVSPSERKRQMYAEQYGVGADELDAYAEGAAPVSDLGSMGSVSSGFLKKKKTIEGRLQEAGMSYADAVSEYGKDSEQALSAKNTYDGLRTIKDTLDPDKANWASTVGALKMTMLNGETPEIRAAAEKEYNRVLAIEAKGKKEDSKIPTLSILARLFSSTASRALNEKFGSEQSKDLIIETLPDGSGTYKYIGQDSAKRKKVNDYARSVIEKMAQPYLDKNGVPINTDVATALRSMLIPFDDQGRPIFTPMPSADPNTDGQEKPKVVLPPATGKAAPAAQEAPQEKKVTMDQIRQMADKRAANRNNTLPTDVATIMEDMKKNGYAIIGE
jgi:hypothetical protein